MTFCKIAFFYCAVCYFFLDSSTSFLAHQQCLRILSAASPRSTGDACACAERCPKLFRASLFKVVVHKNWHRSFSQQPDYTTMMDMVARQKCSKLLLLCMWGLKNQFSRQKGCCQPLCRRTNVHSRPVRYPDSGYLARTYCMSSRVWNWRVRTENYGSAESSSIATGGGLIFKRWFSL